MSGVAPRDRPVVAAEERGVAAAERGRLGQGNGPRRAKVEDTGGRDARGGEGLAHDRRIPLRAGRSEERGELGGQGAVKDPKARLGLGILALQVEEHGEGHEDRVLGLPGPGHDPERQVLEGRRPERREAFVYAFSVGVDDGLVGRQGGRTLAGRDVAKAVDPRLAVDVQGRGPEQLGQLARGAAAKKVHLEEAVLRVDEAGGAGHVEPALPDDARHSEGVALHPHRGPQSPHRAAAFDRGQAGQKLRAAPGPQPHGHRREQSEQDEGDPKGPSPSPARTACDGGHRLRPSPGRSRRTPRACGPRPSRCGAPRPSTARRSTGPGG